MVKKILSIVVWVITAGALVALFVFAREYYLDKPIQSVTLIPESDSGFVKRSVLHDDIVSMCVNKKVGTANMLEIQQKLNDNPWIESNTSYIDLDGHLNVSFKEYKPQLRVFGKDGRSVYLTDEGTVIPSSSIYTPYVLIASGNFDIQKDSVAHQLNDSIQQDINLINALYWFKAINANSFIKNCTGQLYCNPKNEFELTVRGIEAKVIVGDTCFAANKLKRLEIFMKQRINSQETKTFKSINLNFKNQIVCTK